MVLKTKNNFKIKSPSLDRFFIKIKRHIILAQAYTGIKNLHFIFTACRLKPYEFFTDKINYKLILYRHWFDEFGNSIIIHKNKHIKTIFNDLSLDQKKISCTDLYYNLSLDKICKMSKLFFLNHIQYQEDDNIFISFLGLDNYLRTYYYLDNEWIQVSPLYLGWKNLKSISQNISVQDFKKLNIKEEYEDACTAQTQWISLLPPTHQFQKIMKAEFGDLLQFIK